MGWKTLKERFDIKHHVQVTGKGICIGSGFVPDIVVIDPLTGKMEVSHTFSSFVTEEYPQLGQASPEELVALLEQPDQFSVSLPVFTHQDGTIVEKVCEQLGWPNVTHDGHMMFENTYSSDKATVIRWAKQSADIAIHHYSRRIPELEAEVLRAKEALQIQEAIAANLQVAYPDIN